MSKKPRSKATSDRGGYRKGQSRNLGGRPIGSSAPRLSAFDVIMEKRLTVTRDGITREATTVEALQQRIYQDALAGDRMAQREVMKWILKREKWLKKQAPPKPARPPVKTPISPDPDNADAALLLLEVAALNPKRAEFGLERAQLLLEPWAVQASLRRRRGGQRLTSDERDNIRRSTRDPDSIRWPRGTDQ